MHAVRDSRSVKANGSSVPRDVLSALDSERDRVVDRFRVVRDDTITGSIAFDILECGPGTLRLLQPSRRGYERYYIGVALLVAAFALPFILGVLPWQILARGGSSGLPPDALGLGILYFLLALGAIVAWSLYAPRLADRRPKTSMPAVVLEAELGKRPHTTPRIRVRAGDDTFWLTVQAKPAALRSALALAGQTGWEPTKND